MRFKLVKQILITGVLLGIITFSIKSTISYFQDLESLEGNIFSAGTLDLSMGQSSEAIWKAENMMPGDEIEGELELKNNGSIPIESLLMEVEIE
jgi:spore coat-associated protein N